MTDVLEISSHLVREGEGRKLTAYKDTVGKTTIGWGRNLDDKGIGYAEAELLLANDITEARNELHTRFKFFNDLSPVRQAVLVDMYHNLGMSGLLTFRNMLSALREENYKEAANQIKQSRYWRQVGNRAKRNYCMMYHNRIFTKEEAEKEFA